MQGRSSLKQGTFASRMTKMLLVYLLYLYMYHIQNPERQIDVYTPFFLIHMVLSEIRYPIFQWIMIIFPLKWLFLGILYFQTNLHVYYVYTNP
jgi:hypothetical protein